MPDTRALVFDVFGTLVDWRGSLLHEAAGLRSAPDAADWPSLIDDLRRAYQPALDRVGSEGTWRDLDEVHRGTLGDVLGRHHIALSAHDRDTLVGAWRRLRPWPDTRAGLERLRSGYRTATLSNGHVALLVDLFRFGDLRVDTLLSAQLADTYKPMPRAYLRALSCSAASPGRSRWSPRTARTWSPRRGSACGRCSCGDPPSGGRGASRRHRPGCRAWSSPTTSSSWPTSSVVDQPHALHRRAAQTCASTGDGRPCWAATWSASRTLSASSVNVGLAYPSPVVNTELPAT
jgi:2-haloacid dehalogenase